MLFGVLVEHRHHLLSDAVGNFVLLPLEFVVGVFIVALEGLLLTIDLLQQVAACVFIELVTGGAELFLEIFDVAVERFKFAAFRVNFFRKVSKSRWPSLLLMIAA